MSAENKQVISREGSTDIHAQTAGSKAVKYILITLSVVFLFVMLVMPLITVIYEAFRKGLVPYLEAVSDPDTISALLLTLEATVIAVVINTVFGLFAAWAISKFRFHGKKLLMTLIDLPVTVSPIIAGLIFVLTFGRQSAIYPFLESIDFMVVYAVPGIILATVFVTFPFISREILPVLEAQGTDEEEAAAIHYLPQDHAPPYQVGAAVRHSSVCSPCNGRVRSGIGAVRTSARQDCDTAPSGGDTFRRQQVHAGICGIVNTCGACNSNTDCAKHRRVYRKETRREIMYIELKNINKSYGDFKASDNVNFEIEKGRLVALLGPSGSGKTTILRMIAGLERPDSGEIIIDGKVVNDIPASERGIGFVFQSYALFRYMTVFDNIAFGLKVRKMNKAAIKERVTELVKLIGLEGFENRYPSQLSGGQRQRVAFARALAPNPQVLLLDEPFAAIDAKVRQELRKWLKDMIHKLGVTGIFVTHDQDEAIEVSDEIIVTNKGRVEQSGTPIDIYRNPTTAFTSAFFGVTSELKDYKAFKSFDEVDEYDKAIVRPEFVKITKKSEVQKYKSSAVEGRVETVEFRGNSIEITVSCNGSIFSARRSLDEPAVEVGETVDVFIYRIFITHGDSVKLLKNNAIREETVVI